MIPTQEPAQFKARGQLWLLMISPLTWPISIPHFPDTYPPNWKTLVSGFSGRLICFSNNTTPVSHTVDSAWIILFLHWNSLISRLCLGSRPRQYSWISWLCFGSGQGELVGQLCSHIIQGCAGLLEAALRPIYLESTFSHCSSSDQALYYRQASPPTVPWYQATPGEPDDDFPALRAPLILSRIADVFPRLLLRTQLGSV